MATARTRIKLPPSARPGELVEVTTLIGHPMETGYRLDAEGRAVPRDILRRFSCHLEREGAPPELLFSAELHPAIAANPYLAFAFVATRSGTLRMRWEGDQGFSHVETATLTVA
jgi:sulfur-oxidizing protein SoxZ